ncbi:MAG: AraC family transcriptional regulator [Bacteroidia bacterium]|nr:AraC family transcriptional regulator [Bacteroidia bacterium]
MAVNFNIYSVVLLFGFVQAVIYAVLLIVRGIREQRLSDHLLAALLMMAAIILLPYMLGFMGIPVIWTTLLFFPTDPGLLLGPAVYYYLVCLTDMEFRFKKQHLWHILPIGAYIVYRLSVFLQGSAFVQLWIEEVDIPYIRTMVEISTLTSNYLYLFLTIRHYNRYRKWVETQFSNTQEIRFSWYRNYLLLIAAVFTCSWFFSLLNTFGVQLSFTQNWWEYVFISIAIYIMSIRGFQQKPPVLIHFPLPQTQTPEPEKNRLPDKEMENTLVMIRLLMEKEKLYLQPDLSLREVSQRLNLPNTLVSQVINTGLGQNFNQFVNTYRINAFRQAAQNPSFRHLSLLAIAMDCGFNSKATFNRVFKQTTGVSPRDFLSQHTSDTNTSGQE